MSIWRQTSVATRAAVIALSVANAATAHAAAKTHPKKPQGAPALSSAVPAPSAPASAPARFFTINQVLAKQAGRPDPTETWELAAATPPDRATDAPTLAPARSKSGDGPFGLMTFRAPEGPLWAKWRTVEAGIETDRSVLAQCRTEGDQCTSPAARRFLAIEDKATHEHTGRAAIDVINRSINNAIRYTSDLEQHGVVNVWMTPLASLASGQGDCKDYAIAKYAALQEIGLAAEDLQILIVRDRAVRQDHAVVAVRNDGHWLILDNRFDLLPRPEALPSFQPLFAIDHQGVKLLAAPYAALTLEELLGAVASTAALSDADPISNVPASPPAM
jgi:predicted transglutaminase-like cysteine proteinase